MTVMLCGSFNLVLSDKIYSKTALIFNIKHCIFIYYHLFIKEEIQRHTYVYDLSKYYTYI